MLHGKQMLYCAYEMLCCAYKMDGKNPEAGLFFTAPERKVHFTADKPSPKEVHRNLGRSARVPAKGVRMHILINWILFIRGIQLSIMLLREMVVWRFSCQCPSMLIQIKRSPSKHKKGYAPNWIISLYRIRALLTPWHCSDFAGKPRIKSTIF